MSEDALNSGDVSEPRRGRSRSRKRRESKSSNDAAGSGIVQKPFRRFRYNTPPVDFISSDELESIHLESLRVLAELGIRVLHDEARSIMRAAGAEVDDASQMVTFDSALIESLVSLAPENFLLHARNPEHTVSLGGDEAVFAMMASAPNASCLDHGRRTGNQQDYQNFLRLSQMHSVLQINGGYPVEPVDLHAGTRHLDCIRDLLRLTDKGLGIYSLGLSLIHI